MLSKLPLPVHFIAPFDLLIRPRLIILYSHIEAISNVAATLYCLNRHSEAESHWQQAVRKKPTYLEAVEHLVGL